MNDLPAKRVAVAWQIYAPPFVDDEYDMKKDNRAQLAKLWQTVSPIDYGRLAEIAGVPVSRAVKIFARLKSANLIWPDGTMSEEARQSIIRDVSVYVAPAIQRRQTDPKGQATNVGQREKHNVQAPVGQPGRHPSRGQTA